MTTTPKPGGLVSRSAYRTCRALAAALLISGVIGPSYAASTGESASLERGQALYDAHCRQCHTESIHRRPNKMPLTRDELMGIVDHFRRATNLAWTPEEVDDVTEYLNRTQYRLGR